MQRAVLLALLLAAAPLAGCIGGDDGADQAETASTVEPGDLVDVDAIPETVNDDPVHAAHADANHPTINDPTANLETDQVPSWWAPPEAVEVPDEITGVQQKSTVADGENRGAGFAVFGSLAIMPSYAHETSIFDISDPENPEHLADLAEPPARDAHPLPLSDGRLFAVFATDTGEVPVFNLTDPTNPEKVATIEPERGSHNVEILPGTAYLYNSASNGGGDGSQVEGQGSGGTAIYDLSDPSNPELVTDFENGYSCHDIKFGMWPGQDKHRAYCAGHQMTQIWDVADPANPEVIVNVPVHHGVAGAPSTGVAPAMFSHLAMPNEDGTILIVGDETGGGLAPGCDAHVDAAGTTTSGPLGNLWFYDISDEEDPQLQGWYSPDHHYTYNPPHDDRLTEIGAAGVPPGCTAHFGHLLPQKDTIAMGFYGAGVVILDFSDPANPQVVDQWYVGEDGGTSVWDVWYYQGHLFTGDLVRTMDVLTLE
jgi:hypothetical protein